MSGREVCNKLTIGDVFGSVGDDETVSLLLRQSFEGLLISLLIDVCRKHSKLNRNLVRDFSNCRESLFPNTEVGCWYKQSNLCHPTNSVAEKLKALAVKLHSAVDIHTGDVLVRPSHAGDKSRCYGVSACGHNRDGCRQRFELTGNRSTQRNDNIGTTVNDGLSDLA